MQHSDYLIIGGGPAGTTAAETIRQQNAEASVTIVSAEPYPYYSRIMLSKPKLILGQIPPEKIYLKNDAWYQNNKITLIKGISAKNLEENKKIITLSDGQQITYKKLLLALGTKTRLWDVPGCELECISYVKTMADAKLLIRLVPQTKQAIVIGSSFISFEICHVLREANIKTTVVMLEPYFWYPFLNETAGKIVEEALNKNNITIIREQKIKEVLGKKMVGEVLLTNGQKLKTDLIICGIGAVSGLDWLKNSGLKINRGIIANKFLQTNLSDVWTAGDIAEFEDVIINEQHQLGSWANAQMQGRAAALNMLGKKEIYANVSTYSTSGFGLTISFVGSINPKLKEKTLSRGPAAGNKYTTFIIKENRLIGAVIINNGANIAPISKLIKNKQNISRLTAKLSDPEIKLDSLIK